MHLDVSDNRIIEFPSTFRTFMLCTIIIDRNPLRNNNGFQNFSCGTIRKRAISDKPPLLRHIAFCSVFNNRLSFYLPKTLLKSLYETSICWLCYRRTPVLPSLTEYGVLDMFLSVQRETDRPTGIPAKGSLCLFCYNAFSWEF
ncbi:unnamed protein product [Dracunculus medinensis]|uniref:Leucine Rich repeat-containing domain protein n=1 Tax=Dracunculus medinensis TaxID=318479 RepID=A0A0N4UDB0_DRAME|nr:unnamed protein product [Dracunculus medinensis]